MIYEKNPERELSEKHLIHCTSAIFSITHEILTTFITYLYNQLNRSTELSSIIVILTGGCGPRLSQYLGFSMFCLFCFSCQ